ncbi:MAG: ABC transporter substrate-binding protein [Desulfocapsa sp.]|nr:ABC transporter substrate-binding protein [Desulfocapsa sp.]
MTGKHLFVVGLFFIVSSYLSVAVAVPSPTESLKPLLNEMMTIITDPSLAGEEHKKERRAKIMAVANQGFNWTEMSKRVLGKPWHEINQKQRDNFEQLFTKLLENAYVGKLEGYSSQVITFNDERVKEEKAVVSTTIEDNGVILPVHYIMIQQNTTWKVYDINIEGVSLVQNYREQFRSILRKDNFDGLVKMLEEKNATFDGEGS